MYYVVGRAVLAGVGILVAILATNVITCKLVEKLNVTLETSACFRIFINHRFCTGPTNETKRLPNEVAE